MTTKLPLPMPEALREPQAAPGAVLSAWVPVDTRDRLDAVCARLGCSRSHLLRVVLDAALDHYEGQ